MNKQFKRQLDSLDQVFDFVYQFVKDNNIDDKNAQINANGDIVWEVFDGTDTEIFLATSVTISESVDIGKCGPCCSIEPTGITATCFFFDIDFLRTGSN